MSEEPKSTKADLEKMQFVVDSTPGSHTVSVDVENDCSKIVDGTGRVAEFIGSTIGTAGKPLEGDSG